MLTPFGYSQYNGEMSPRTIQELRIHRIMFKKIFTAVPLLLAFLSPALAWGQRPSAPMLFSQKTLLYARVDDTRELKAKMAQTSMGKISEDRQLKPILGSFYSTFSNLVQGMQESVGVNLDELLSIPNGELSASPPPTAAPTRRRPNWSLQA